MRRLLIAMPAMALLGLLAAPAPAQRSGPVRPEALLFLTGVQEELKLTPDQKAALQKLAAKRDEAFKAYDKGDRAKGQALLDEANRGAGEVMKALDARQRRRFDQIELQTAGLFGLLRDKVQGKLRLTPEQKKAVLAILKHYTRQATEAFKGIRKDFKNYAEIEKKVEGLKRESQKKVLALLTPEQKKAWQELVGKPFVFKPDAPPATGGKPVKQKKD